METKTLNDSKKFFKQQVINKGRNQFDEVDEELTDNLDDLQIQLNNLHSENFQEQLLSIQFFADFIEDGNFIPPELFIQFRNDILAFLAQISALPQLQASNILMIVSNIVEFFEDDFDYSSLFQTIWALIPNDDAIHACGKIITQSQSLSQELLGNEGFLGVVQGFLQDPENSDLRNSGIFLVCALADNKENHIMMRNFFDIICNLLENDDETKENIIAIIQTLKLFASSDTGITFITDRNDLSNLLHNVINIPEIDKEILAFLLRIGETSSNCIKIYNKLEVLDFIFSNVNNQTSDKMERTAIRILYCISQDNQDGIQVLFANGILQSLLEKIGKSRSLWNLALSTLCACCYKGSVEVTNALTEAGFVDIIDQNIDSSSDNLVNDLLLALQAIIATAELQGNESLISELAGNDDLIDKIFALTEDKEGEGEGKIASFIYSKLTGE